MTDEPVYEYIKGQGWVPNISGCESYRAKDLSGKEWIVYKRPAEVGEFWDCTGDRYFSAQAYAETFIESARRLGLSRATTREVEDGTVGPDKDYSHAYAIVPVDGVYD